VQKGIYTHNLAEHITGIYNAYTVNLQALNKYKGLHKR
jgi:hypothetical protein